MESILTSIKKTIGIEKDYTHFDPDIILHANGAFATLNQLGIGPKEGFRIDNDDLSWDSFLPKGPMQNLVRQYVPLKVKMVFDPTSSSIVNDSIKSIITELEWRMHEQAEYDAQEDTNG